MKNPSFVILSAIFGAIAVGIVVQWRTRERLVYELDAMRQRDPTNARRQTQINKTSAPKADDKRPPERTPTEMPQPAGKAVRKSDATSTAVEANLSAAGLIRSESWRNAGRLTPSAAFETLEWALDRGETDILAASLAFEPEVKIKLDELFAHLSPEVRSKYITPENIIALLVAGTSKGPQAFQVLGETLQGQDMATVRVKIQEPDGRVEENNVPLRHEAEGWKNLIPEHEALKKIREFFPEATWKTVEQTSAGPTK